MLSMMRASSGDGSSSPAKSAKSAAAAMTVPTGKDHPISRIPHILPHERVFPIQIGGKLYKLSGASLSSDAPSYFSQHFLCQIKVAEENEQDLCSAIKTLYIDRDPETFRDIALHLQGYHVAPRDGTHFVRLFADAQFYNLPKLMSQLYDESIFISIGHHEFQIPRDLFTDPGNSPNFFSLGFGAFFSSKEDLFPSLDRTELIRPPSIVPPSVPNRNADTFAELLRLLRGYPVNIRDEIHRSELLADARYFHFKGLEQKLIPHSIAFNQARQRNEITLRLENIQKSGVSVAHDQTQTGGATATGDASPPVYGWVHYARPFVDDRPAELVVEIGGESTKILFSGSRSDEEPRVEFFRETCARVARLLDVVATKLNLAHPAQSAGLPVTPGNTPLSDDLVRVSLPPEASIVLDGREYAGNPDHSAAEHDSSVAQNPRKRRRGDISDSDAWIVKTGQWRLRIQPAKGGKAAVKCVLVAVKIDAVSSELGRNAAKGFLGG